LSYVEPPGPRPETGCTYCYHTWGTADGGTTWEWIPHWSNRCDLHDSESEL